MYTVHAVEANSMNYDGSPVVMRDISNHRLLRCAIVAVDEAWEDCVKAVIYCGRRDRWMTLSGDQRISVLQCEDAAEEAGLLTLWGF